MKTSLINDSETVSFAQFRGKRDYRALIFCDQDLKTEKSVFDLFDGVPLNAAEAKKLPPLSGDFVTGVRVKYFSDQCFLRSSDTQRKTSLLVPGRQDLYEYEVCVLAYRKQTHPIFLVAVPFSGMARELFGKIHNRKPSAKFKYLRPSLEKLIDALVDRQKAFSKVKTAGINWAVAGDTGRSDQITIRGADVVNSVMFRHMITPGSQLSFALRKVQIIHEGFGGTEKLRLTFDKFGNYGVWVGVDGTNLSDVFSIYEIMRKAKLIEEESAFPVRNREDQPLLP